MDLNLTINGKLTVIIDNRGNAHKLDSMLALMQLLLAKETQIMATLDEIIAATAEQKTVLESLVAFVNGLEEQIKAISDFTPEQQAQLDGIFTQITANTEEVANAMVQNTPAEGN